jgi:hypothetical protein
MGFIIVEDLFKFYLEVIIQEIKLIYRFMYVIGLNLIGMRTNNQKKVILEK